MEQFEIVVPVMFGIEAVCAREIKNLGYETTKVEDGRITFLGDAEAVARANICLRTAERILIKVGEFSAVTFDELFEKTKELPWENWITKHNAFPVKGFSRNSKLFSVSDCQSIIKKSIVERLKQKYRVSWFDEKGAPYQIQFSIIKDTVCLMIDTSGDGLHKRGYRRESNLAPLKETIATAMVQLSFYRPEKWLADPFCGSGTILIEAGLIAKNIAPGLYRAFAGEKFSQLPKDIWEKIREEAKEAVREDTELHLIGSDIDPECVRLTLKNARLAGLDGQIRAQVRDVRNLSLNGEYGCIMCNPPYGERMGEVHKMNELYRDMYHAFSNYPTWSWYVITSHSDFEKSFGKPASKRRKLYNGMIRCDFYQYFGPKPPKENVK